MASAQPALADRIGFPLADRLRRIHDEVERAALAHTVMTLESATALARDDATDRYVRAMDRIFDELDAMRRSGELAGIETLVRRLG
jgi:hypothetical protein